MANGKASTKSTGGGGFTFADKVAAGFLTMMLRRDLLGADLGPVTEIEVTSRRANQEIRWTTWRLLFAMSNRYAALKARHKPPAKQWILMSRARGQRPSKDAILCPKAKALNFLNLCLF
jgi:hypothetical protein